MAVPRKILVFDEKNGDKSLFIHIPALFVHELGLYRELSELNDDKWGQKKFMRSMIPRLIRWHSLNGGDYKFAGRKWKSLPYPKELKTFQAKLPRVMKKLLGNSLEGVPFHWDRLNSVLINKYRNNRDSISAHADDEKEFGDKPTIVSVNFGAPRRFKIQRMTESERKRSWEKRGKPFTPLGFTDPKASIDYFDLDHGDALVMAGSTQDFWKHSVPKENENPGVERLFLLPGRKRLCRREETTERFNLTFRPYIQ